MRLGVLGGFLTGAILSGVVLGAASYMTEVPGQAPPEAANLDVPAGSEFNQSREDRQASLPAADETPEPEGAPRVEPPEPDDLSSLKGTDMAPATQPVTGSAEGTLDAPEAQTGGSGVEVDSDDPVLPSPQALAPEAPEGEADPAVSTEPAEPPAPEPEADPEAESSISTDPEQPALPEVEEESGVIRPAAEPGEEGMGQEEARAEETDAQEAAQLPARNGNGEAAASEDVMTDEGMAEDPPAPDTATAPEPVGEEAAKNEMAGDATDGDETAGQEMAGQEMAAQEAAEEEDDAPSGTIGNLAEDVTTGRLPSVADEDIPEEEPLPPLQKYAAPFDNPENKPLMAIVLIDDGSSPVSYEALADFPYPISYAVDADWPGAAEAARKYRAAGLEVLALADLPEGASARDTEVAMQVFLDAVPQAVAVMEGTDTGLQSSREATEQLIPILQDSGHGLVLFSEGLDTAQKLIAREGVPVVSVFRDFDGEGQNATAIRRFLDQAAFKAGQSDAGVVMVGRLRAETVSALLLWGLQDRAASVALAPVSAVLRNAQ